MLEVKFSNQPHKIETGRINPRDLTNETYPFYCRQYLIDKIWEVIPSTSTIRYRDVSKIINSISPVLFKNLRLETNRILLLNYIFGIFMSATDEELSREFLYGLVKHISECDPENFNPTEPRLI